MSKPQKDDILRISPHEVRLILRSVRAGLCTIRLAADLLHLTMEDIQMAAFGRIVL